MVAATLFPPPPLHHHHRGTCRTSHEAAGGMDRGDLAQVTQWPMTSPGGKHSGLPAAHLVPPPFRSQAGETVAINVGSSLGAMP